MSGAESVLERLERSAQLRFLRDLRPISRPLAEWAERRFHEGFRMIEVTRVLKDNHRVAAAGLGARNRTAGETPVV